jgi:hypothetical protein
MRCHSIAAALFASLLIVAGSARAEAAEEWTRISRAVVSQSKADASARRSMLELAAEAISQARGDGNGNGGNGSHAGASIERHDAAVAVAAFGVLERLAPEQREELESRLAVHFSRIPETDAKAEGAVLGRSIAARVLQQAKRAPGIHRGP